jgi:hypothetical protein
MRASGVGGGSLVYSNITILPPDLVLDDPRWPKWDTADRVAPSFCASPKIPLVPKVTRS